MTDTKTIELPLTKSEQRHADNIRRRDQKRRRSQERRDSITERDAKIKKINDEFVPKLQKLQEQRQRELKAVWDEWRKSRSTS